MGNSAPVTCPPDLSARPFDLSLARRMPIKAAAIYDAWTRRFDLWFAAPGSVLMRPEVDAPFFFETVFKLPDTGEIRRHPHYGRFLRLAPDRLVELTWLTGEGGTEGAETVVRVELDADGRATTVRLTHSGFPNAAARDCHAQAWRAVLEQLEKRLLAEAR